MKKWYKNILLIISSILLLLGFCGCDMSVAESSFTLPSKEILNSSAPQKEQSSSIVEPTETKQWGAAVSKDDTGKYEIQQIGDVTFELPGTPEYSWQFAQTASLDWMYKATDSNGKSMTMVVSYNPKEGELRELSAEEKSICKSITLDGSTKIQGEKGWIRMYVIHIDDLSEQYVEERWIDYKDNIYTFSYHISLGGVFKYVENSDLNMSQQSSLFNEIIESIVLK